MVIIKMFSLPFSFSIRYNLRVRENEISNNNELEDMYLSSDYGLFLFVNCMQYASSCTKSVS